MNLISQGQIQRTNLNPEKEIAHSKFTSFLHFSIAYHGTQMCIKHLMNSSVGCRTYPSKHLHSPDKSNMNLDFKRDPHSHDSQLHFGCPKACTAPL
ncbi:hypothetical protein Hanom_Chr03g00222131 [Helianthus anomalus]